MLGRFGSADPRVPEPGNPQALNRYAYVLNTPICYTDPSGHCPWCLVIGKVLLQTVVDVGVDDLIARATGTDFRLVDSLKVNVALHVTTLGVGSTIAKLRHLGKVVALAGHADEAADAVRAAESVAEITNPLPRTQRFAHVLPERVARDIEAGLKDVYLGKPGDPDVFITAAEDLARYRTQASVERRLALPPSSERRAVVTFKYDVEAGIASPVFRDSLGFVGKGRTLGGAREWVIPNRPLKEMPVWDIKVRYLK